MNRCAGRIVLVMAVAVLLAPPAVSAQLSAEPPTDLVLGIKAANFGKTTLEQGHFSYSLPSGASVEDGIILINYKAEPIVVRLYAADLIAAKGGGLAPAQRDAKMNGVGAWLKLDDPEMSTVGVPANGRVTVPFELRIPKGTPPGDYPGAVVASLDTGRSPNGLSVQTRAALMVRLTVPGKINLGVGVGELRIKRVEDGYRFDVDVRNTGNVLFTMVGNVELRRGGDVISRVPLTPSGIYAIPDGKVDLRGVWKSPPAFGRVKALARISVAINRKPSGTFSSPAKMFTLLPLLIASVVLGLVALSVALAFVTRKRRREWLARRRDEKELLHAHRAGRSRPIEAEDSVPASVTIGSAAPLSEMDFSWPIDVVRNQVNR